MGLSLSNVTILQTRGLCKRVQYRVPTVPARRHNAEQCDPGNQDLHVWHIKRQHCTGPSYRDRVISIGYTKTGILIKCGEPHYKSSHQKELKDRIDDSDSHKVIVTVEEWTYNFGPQQFLA